MHFTEALEKVSKAYEPGTIAFYSKMNPNQWELMETEFESHVLGKSWEEISRASEAYVSRALELIAAYKKVSLPSKRLDQADAFMLGSVDRLEAWNSVKHKACKICGVKVGLKIRDRKDDPDRVEVVCLTCDKKAA